MGVSGILPLSTARAVRENPQAAATASGFTIAMAIVGTMTTQPLMGFIVESFDKEAIPFVLLVLSVVGVLIALFLIKHHKEPVFFRKKI